MDWKEIFNSSASQNNSKLCTFHVVLRREAVKTDVVMEKPIVTTSLQKAIRRGDWKRAALYAVLLSQCDSWYFWRRLRVIALEDLLLPPAFTALYGLQREYEAECASSKKRYGVCASWDGQRVAIAAAIWLADGAPQGPRKDRRADAFMEMYTVAYEACVRKGVCDVWDEIKKLFEPPEEWLDVHVKKWKGERSWVEEGAVVDGPVSDEHIVFEGEWRSAVEKLYRVLGKWEDKKD